MLLYHGSNRQFQQFEISETLVQHNIDHLAEGLGIYLTDDPSFATSYGDYVYEVEVQDDAISDFTSEREIIALLDSMSKRLGVPLVDWIDIDKFVQSVQSGNISVTKLYHEIRLILENNEAFYATYEEDFSDQIQEAFFEEIKDVLKYYDPSFKRAIYICIKHPQNLVLKNR